MINQVLGARITIAPITLSQLADADAVFTTNAAVGVRPVSAIDSSRSPISHPRLDSLYKQYADIRPERL